MDGQPAEGAAVTNPASFTIGAKGQFAAVLPEIFGSGIQDAEPVTVIIHSRIVEPVILFLVGDNENTLLDGTIFDQQALKAFALPILGREGLGPFTKVYAFNPSTETPSGAGSDASRFGRCPGRSPGIRTGPPRGGFGGTV